MGGKVIEGASKISRDSAEPLVKKLLETLSPLSVRIEICGSYRRKKSTIGDLDVVLIPNQKMLDGGLPPWLNGNISITHGSRSHFSLKTDMGETVQVDVYIATEADWGAQVQNWTGSKWHNISLRSKAKKRGWKYNQYGLFNERDERIAGETEESVYKALGYATTLSPERRD